MDNQEVLNKLAQIEEQATYTLAEFPKSLTKERLRMIIALARYLRTELASEPSASADASLRLAGQDDDVNARRA